MKLSDYKKNRIENQCKPLIEKFKSEYVAKNPNKEFNYLVDIYIKWYRDNLYFCGKYKSESPNRIVDEFEEKFVRLKATNRDKFDISYMRHTGKWFTIASCLTLNECLKMIEGAPILHPIG